MAVNELVLRKVYVLGHEEHLHDNKSDFRRDDERVCLQLVGIRLTLILTHLHTLHVYNILRECARVMLVSCFPISATRTHTEMIWTGTL